MSVLIKGMEMPKSCQECRWRKTDITNTDYCQITLDNVPYIIKFPASCPLIEVPAHGRLIDADALRAKMYHDAFETDSLLQKWDSGCWIRYKMFEDNEENAPTVIPADTDLETLSSGVYNPPVKGTNYPPTNWCGEEAIGDE